MAVIKLFWHALPGMLVWIKTPALQCGLEVCLAASSLSCMCSCVLVLPHSQGTGLERVLGSEFKYLILSQCCHRELRANFHLCQPQHSHLPMQGADNLPDTLPLAFGLWCVALPALTFIFLLLKRFIYLYNHWSICVKERATEKTGKSFDCWFTLHVAITARAGPGWHQEPRTPAPIFLSALEILCWALTQVFSLLHLAIVPPDPVWGM